MYDFRALRLLEQVWSQSEI